MDGNFIADVRLDDSDEVFRVGFHGRAAARATELTSFIHFYAIGFAAANCEEPGEEALTGSCA